ncbi:7-carboxy-7-deazaguanine synthase [Rhodoferax sp.]|uniref:7-carboxy-7-deazaguanine synthase n=1 Tax=Rhodoferax sp. TaxID=50421 RepID=UPI001ED2A347|nr:7-carboxy-7-deazaguanine synthase [Rhodoferax sp.]MBT9506275.1 7-carboxy-7-deazaguanine synthase [Rhodoferax sp.]
MTYSVKEIFYTLQGEGAQSGKAAVFCRFAGCNLWSGREEDRAGAVCQFCDTDFVGTDGTGGGKFTSAEALAEAVVKAWEPVGELHRMVVLTGGEPLLQVDEPLIQALHARGFFIAVETNGTVAPPPGLDWLCVSPKSDAELVIQGGNEIKLVYPQAGVDPARFEKLAFDHFFLQPMDSVLRADNTARTIDYCQKHPQWRLGVQSHKIIGIR